MKSHKASKAILRVAALATGILAAAAPGISTAARAQEELKATIGFYPGTLISMPAFVAQDKEFFLKNGLKTALVPINTGPAMTSAVASGSVTFVNNAWDNLIVAVDKGLPVRGVAGSAVKVPFSLIARKDVPLPNLEAGYPDVLKDLIGKKWGVVALGVSVQYLSQKLLTDAGYKPEDVTFLAVGMPATGRPALQNGMIDTYLSVEPLPSIVEAKGEGHIVIDLAAEKGPKFFEGLGYNGWWASTSTINDNPKVVEGFVKAMQDSYCWYSDPANFEELVVVMKKYADVPELSDDQYKAMVKRLLPTFGPTIDSRTIDTWSQLVMDLGQIKTPKTRVDVIDASAPETYSCAK